jgi:predicted NodU family carbamoyl transferase
LKDGKLVAAMAEERLGLSHKHVAGFPGRTIEVLRMGRLVAGMFQCYF